MTTATATWAEPLLPGFELRWADVRGVRMRYFLGGEGSPLVLVHGLSGAASNWCELAPLLARGRRVLVPDLPGHGGSGPLPAAPSLNASPTASGTSPRSRTCSQRPSSATRWAVP